MAFPFLGPYVASKFALEALSDALRVELSPWGMHVSLVEPGTVATPIFTKTFDRVMASVERASATRAELPTDTVVVCAGTAHEGEQLRVRIASPAGWVDAGALAEALPP